MSSQLLSLEGKIAVITGGTSGIGRALSLGLAEAGANVIATARRQQQVDETAAEIEKLGRETPAGCDWMRFPGRGCPKYPLQQPLLSPIGTAADQSTSRAHGDSIS